MTAPINWGAFERVRKHRLHMTMGQMASVFGVTRMTYYRWVTGVGKVPMTKRDRVMNTVVKVLKVSRSGEWTAVRATGDPVPELLEKMEAYS